MNLRILYVGATNKGDTSNERMSALRELGNHVEKINSSPKPVYWKRLVVRFAKIFKQLPDLYKVNTQIIEHMSSNKFDLLWVDKGIVVQRNTLLKIKKLQPNCRLIHINPDDPFGKFDRGWWVFKKAVPIYDVHFVPRLQNIEEYKAIGGRHVFTYDRSFSKNLHRPLALTNLENVKYGSIVGFIGSHAPERAASIAFLIQQGIPLSIYGNGWSNNAYWEIISPFYRGPGRNDDEYVKTINGMQIALHFLRHENRDEQDSRTFEIPACGTFMLAERSPKHEELFLEDKEAVFFSNDYELLQKIKYYLRYSKLREKISQAGYKRCIESGYDHQHRLISMIQVIQSL